MMVIWLLFLMAKVEGLAMNGFLSLNITRGTVLVTIEVARSCSCRVACGEGCTAVTAVKKSEESFYCHTTSEPAPSLSFGPSIGSTTHVKGKHCLAPCSVISGLGMLSFTSTKGGAEDVPQHCGKDAGLYSPGTIARFDTLRQYLMQDSPNDRDCYWIDAKLNPVDMKFYWGTGEPLPEVVGKHPFGSGEPLLSTDEMCLAMFYKKDTEDFNFHLADLSCSAISCKYVCNNNPDS